MVRKLIQEVRCSRCRRSSEVDVSQSKDPFQPIGQNWTCGKPDCAEVAKQPRDKYARPIAIHSARVETIVKPPKYHNEPTTIDGIRFASKKEANRYAELKLMERAGEIEGLNLQPRFDISIDGEHICAFVGDFAYMSRQIVPARQIVEDAKGVRTPVFKLKKKLMKAVLGIEVVEV